MSSSRSTSLMASTNSRMVRSTAATKSAGAGTKVSTPSWLSATLRVNTAPVAAAGAVSVEGRSNDSSASPAAPSPPAAGAGASGGGAMVRTRSRSVLSSSACSVSVT